MLQATEMIMPVTNSFFISATPRTGSSLLAEALEFTGIAGKPREYFEADYEKDWSARLGISAESDYIERFLAAGMTPNGVFGAKVHWHQFVHLKSKLRSIQGNGLSDLELLRRTFPDLKYIFLTRRDKVEQAVSYYKAQRTDIWHVVRPAAKATQANAAQAVAFDVEQIDHWITRFAEDEASWFDYFETMELEPFQVVYEDFLGNYESTVLAILRYLNISMPADLQIVPPRLNKLADEVSQEWVRRYKELRKPARRVPATTNLSYFISTTPRTGGFLLAEGLQSTTIAGRPREYFDPAFEKQWVACQASTPETEYLEMVMAAGTTPNGVFGAKVLWHQFAHLTAKRRLIEGSGACGVELLRRAFPDLRYVFLTRRDKIRQAISYDRAIRTGVWWSIPTTANGDGHTPVPIAEPPPFDFEQIDEWVTRLSQFESSWRRHFQRVGVEPFEVAYEDLAAGYERTVLAILGYLDLPISEGLKVAPPRLEKQADDVTEEWVDRYKRQKGL
jgi:trehalose 2-sulfotransferase